ncbi:MAG: hypothetical protein NTW29_08950 [Bacteroidetes bacterium]|nr:hypothetical protein [Bacteroidota bacterium]
MPPLIAYLLKLSVSLGVVFLFYYFILRKLTFYNHNRWYLLGYTLLSFFIPLINISPVLEKNNWDSNGIVAWIPVLRGNEAVISETVSRHTISPWDGVVAILAIGMLIMLIRLLRQLLSFRRMMKKAVPLAADGMNVYQVSAPIIPFSFGNSIFINSTRHTEEELKEIIRHEFVHVKQRHSLDIIWGELICLINWFNPFAWLLKNAIRQNLEYIADSKVLEKGTNKKQYQYLLLKVTGNNQYSIATKFNFSSLKKRITMMNKTKSAKRQLARLLFLLPATAVLLLAFRNKWNHEKTNLPPETKQVAVGGLVVDAITMEPLDNATIYVKEKDITIKTDANGYYLLTMPVENKPLQFTMLVTKKGYAPLHQTENWGNFSEAHIYDRYGRTIEFFGLSPDQSQNRSFSTLAGNAPGLEGLSYENVMKKLRQLRETPDGYYEGQADTIPARGKYENPSAEFMKRNPSVSRVGWLYSNTDDAVHIMIVKMDGTTEEYNLENEAEVRKAEEKYGKLPASPPQPPAPPAPATVPEVREIAIAGAPLPATPAVPGFELTEVRIDRAPPAPAAPQAPYTVKPLPSGVEKMMINNNKATITLKNGKEESYDLENPAEKKKFEEKYGQVLTPLPPQPPATRVKLLNGRVIEREGVRMESLSNSTGVYKVSGINNGGDPLYVLDGVATSRAELDKLSPNSIAHINVIKGAKAVDTYGEKARDGVVSIVTKGQEPVLEERVLTTSTGNGASYGGSNGLVVESPSISMTNGAKKLVIVDGKEQELSTKPLKGSFKICTLTEAEAVKKYGEKGKNGAVEITTVRN